MIVGIAALSVVFFNTPDEERPMFHPNLGATVMDDGTWEASKRFKNLGDCNASGELDDLTVDWEKIDTYGVANVCLFYLFEQMDGPNEVRGWLLAEGFEVTEPEESSTSPTVLTPFGFDVQSKVTSILAKWSLLEQPKKFPKKVNTTGGYSQSIGVTWFPDGSLLGVGSLTNFN